LNSVVDFAREEERVAVEQARDEGVEVVFEYET
jgi:hypothetical protein